MEIVIDIPDHYYENNIKKELPIILSENNVITILPKGHGRLIDADVLDRDLENAQVNLGDALSEAFDDGLTWASEEASKLPTIIEADGGDAE